MAHKKFFFAVLGLVLVAFALQGCAPRPSFQKKRKPATAGAKKPTRPSHTYKVMGKHYTTLANADGFRQTGLASWYGDKFHGRTTANGETYDMYGRTAAHKTLPFDTMVRVTNLDSGQSIVTRINDRGPFHEGRIIDLTRTHADELSFRDRGTVRVSLEVVGGAGVSAASVPGGQKAYALQVGAFTSVDNAQKLADSLRGDIEPVRVVMALVNGVTFYRVRVGYYTDRDVAEEDRGKLDEDLEATPIIVTLH